MPYYLSAKVNSSYKSIFSILNLSMANIYFTEIAKKDGRSFGVLIGQKFNEKLNTFIGLIMLLTELNDQETLLEILVIGGSLQVINLPQELGKEAHKIIHLLKSKNFKLQICEEIPHMLREFSD